MAALPDSIRKATTLLLAVFLWVHALFFLNVQSAFALKFTRLLRLTASEALLVTLLVIFSFLTASGFWKMVRSLLFIYFFPFVLLAFVFYRVFLTLRAINRWFIAQATLQPKTTLAAVQDSSAIIPVLQAGSDAQAGGKKAPELLRFLLRPFRRFMVLWCILLLVTTHTAIVWLCLTVVLVHLARKIWLVLTILFFSGPWLKRIGSALLKPLNDLLAALTSVACDTAPADDLKKLWGQLNMWRKILNFLKDPYLLSRWAWALAIVFFGFAYVYFAILFSFAYHGIARVSGVVYSWPNALVSSLFIPFYVSDLPKILAVRLLGGVHCTLVVAVGVGTVVNFLRRRLDAVRRSAAELSDRFTDRNVSEKYLILEDRFSSAATSAPPAAK